MPSLRAVLTVTIETKPDGDYYVDHADFVRHVVPWIEGALEGRDDIREVSVVEQLAPVDRAAVLTDAERTMLGYALNLAQEQMYSRGGEFTAEDQAAVTSLRRMANEAQDDEGLSGPCDCGEGAVHYTAADCPAEARRVAAEEQQPETQAEGDTARLAKVVRWVTSEAVTAKTEFGNGYRAAQRDIRDLIKGRFDNDPKPAVVVEPGKEA